MTHTPFTYPHDHEQAGLRDYFQRARRQRRWPFVLALLLEVLAIAAICWLAVGCAPARYVPDRPHPTDAQIRALAEGGVEPKPLTAVALRVMPPLVLAGGAARITCLVPWHAEYRVVAYGLAGVRTVAREADTLAYSLLIQDIPCGSWTAFCAVFGAGGKTLTRQEHTLTSRGSCNEGDDRTGEMP